MKKIAFRNPAQRLGVYHHKNIFDDIAEMLFEIMLNAASVKDDRDKAWAIQHNAIWGRVLDLSGDGIAYAIVQFKIRRLLFDEVKRLEKLPNFKSSKALGYCLNMMGLKLRKAIPPNSYGKEWYSLHKAILDWTKRNYLKLVEVQYKVAESCLIGGISFDKDGKRLIKTYAEGLNIEPDREYLKGFCIFKFSMYLNFCFLAGIHIVKFFGKRGVIHCRTYMKPSV